jgi:hypothetical protein
MTTISSGSQTTQVSRPHAGSRQPTRGIATRRHRPTIARGPQPPMGMWVFAPRSPAIHLPRSIRSAPVRTQPPSRSHSRPPQIHPDLGLGTGRVRVPATNRCPQRQPSQLRPGPNEPECRTPRCCAFEGSMIHRNLQFVLCIASCCVLHRKTSRVIHCLRYGCLPGRRESPHFLPSNGPLQPTRKF